jgi:hypothetical protein
MGNKRVAAAEVMADAVVGAVEVERELPRRLLLQMRLFPTARLVEMHLPRVPLLELDAEPAAVVDSGVEAALPTVGH